MATNGDNLTEALVLIDASTEWAERLLERPDDAELARTGLQTIQWLLYRAEQFLSSH